MDFSSILNKNDPHQRTIIHVDMDCFYAQVEELKDTSLKGKPMGVSQKNSVVTCNYAAREFGIKKMMLIEDALKICPSLILVNGEDLTQYRQMSNKIFEVLQKFTPLVEKLGFDEDFIDVTSIVAERMNNNQQSDTLQIEGFIYPASGTSLFDCDCGCGHRLALGTQIAKEIRQNLFTELGMTCCAGISYNKLLAKLVGSKNKPNKQTVLVSTFAEEFMRELKHLHKVTGIGQKTESLLLESGISNVTELQNCSLEILRKKFGFETATRLKDLSFGRDQSSVRPSGKPKTIGLEDSCRPLSIRTDVEERFRLLLMRLIEQVAEDGRTPVAIKVIIRKFDAQKRTSHRETKQANILPSLFKTTDKGQTILVGNSLEKLLKIIMRLFERIVDLTKPFNITLLGLAFSKFQERKTGSSSIANFLIKKADLEVQSVTSLTSSDNISVSPNTFQPDDQFYRRRTTASPIPMLTDADSPAASSDFSDDVSENEIEPSPKKSRLEILMAKRRCFLTASNEFFDVASPSKLRVSDLRLNSRESEKDVSMSSPRSSSSSTTLFTPTESHTRHPSNLLSRIENGKSFQVPKSHKMSDEYFSGKTAPLENTIQKLSRGEEEEDKSIEPAITITSTSASTCSPIPVTIGNLSGVPCPAGLDSSVFNELPLDVQNELIASWRSSLAAAAAAATSTINGSSATQQAGKKARGSTSAGTAGKSQSNTIYRYFQRNK